MRQSAERKRSDTTTKTTRMGGFCLFRELHTFSPLMITSPSASILRFNIAVTVTAHGNVALRFDMTFTVLPMQTSSSVSILQDMCRGNIENASVFQESSVRAACVLTKDQIHAARLKAHGQRKIVCKLSCRGINDARVGRFCDSAFALHTVERLMQIYANCLFTGKYPFDILIQRLVLLNELLSHTQQLPL